MQRFLRLPLVALAFTVCVAPLAAASNSSESTDANAKAPTFYKDVLPILQDNCQDCHRPNGANLGGMVAPMAFTSYEETRPWARGMARQVEDRKMPPWHASPNQHGVFANERGLTDVEIQTIVDWARSGAPAGDAADAPPPRTWPEVDWTIGEPDLVINMGQNDRYFVADDISDIYVDFVTPITKEMLPEPRWIKAVEFRPGSSVVHHIVAPPLGGIAPGNQPTIYNDGYGTLFKPGDTIRWSMHYHKEPGPGTGVWDQSKVALRFYPKGYTPEHPVVVDPLARFDFEIPAGDPNVTYTTTTKFDRDSLLLSMLPHMHLRGKSAKYIAHYPDGTDEVLLEVPHYDFNWQTAYEYPANALKKIPAGTEIEYIATWDNSAGNAYNPDPSETVHFGQPTTAEMMFGFLTYADAEPGYVPKGGGWLGGGLDGELPLGLVKRILKERMNIDYDSLTPEQQEQVLERFKQQLQARQQAQSQSAGTEGTESAPAPADSGSNAN